MNTTITLIAALSCAFAAWIMVQMIDDLTAARERELRSCEVMHGSHVLGYYDQGKLVCRERNGKYIFWA
jgi:hypothetical protein